MNEHNIQPEPRLRCPPSGEDAPDSVDIQRNGLIIALHRIFVVASLLTCAVGMIGSVCFFCTAFHARRVGWDFVVGFGLWDSLPYALLTIAIWWFRNSFSASIVMFVASMGVTGYGLYALHDGLSPYFNPLRPGEMCCFAPSVQYLLPVFQAVPIAGFWTVAGLLHRFENRYRR